MITEAPIDLSDIAVPSSVRSVLKRHHETPLLTAVLDEHKLTKSKIDKLSKGWPKLPEPGDA